MLKNTLAVVGLLSLTLVAGGASWEALSPTTQITREKPKIDTSKLEGGKPYTPSRLEWLALQLNANYCATRPQERELTVWFSHGVYTDTLLICVGYSSPLDRKFINQAVGSAKSSASIAAQSHGWDSWVKIKEIVWKK